MSQIALPLPTGDGSQAARIVVGNGNAAVVEALRDPSGWPFGTAVLTGPSRSGKSLLASWFEAEGLGQVVDAADRADETALFHRWNRAQENGERLLLVSNAQPWTIALPDLRSRLDAALQLEIAAPDDAMLAELIMAHAGQRRLALGADATTYLVPRASRSYASVERLVATIDRLSLERKAPATLGIWREALEALHGPEQARLL
ncbi:DnaA/Hda family protein [Qipengyuania sp. JC766]|uniref:DnaA ATPase domain-containing protein n=1 Tax=Qipengyuania sp. JC766 TaxID=3232139 RepID=UPI0034599253